MKLTLKEAVDNFRKQWNWIADETLQQKRKVEKDEYFDSHRIDAQDRPLNECHLCEFTRKCMDKCMDCPICWGGKIGTCLNKDAWNDHKGLFVRFIRSNYYIKAANLARKIANLPLKEKYREEYENAID